jgi:hypothetical protein
MGVGHFVVVEPQEVAVYQEAIDRLALLATVLPLDMSYKDRYETLDGHGASRSAARNT